MPDAILILMVSDEHITTLKNWFYIIPLQGVPMNYNPLIIDSLQDKAKDNFQL